MAARRGDCICRHCRYYRRHPEKMVLKAKIGAWRQTARRLLLLQERGGKCVDCGYDNPLALQFDHRDPSAKISDVNRRVGMGGKRAEALKCDVRCANCHMIKSCDKGEMGKRGPLWR